MSHPNPPDGSAQPDTDAGFRHRPAAALQGDTPSAHTQAPPGGLDAAHPHLFHLADATASKGDMVFAPQGHMHYFENASATEDLLVLIVFNASAREPDDDIGLVHSLKAMPPDVLAAVFGGTVEQFRNLPGRHGRVVIARKPENTP